MRIPKGLNFKAFGPTARCVLSLHSLTSISMGTLLATLVIASAVPVLVLAVVMYQQMVMNERESIRGALMSNARALAALVDHEIDTHMAVAGTLSTSVALEEGDLVAFQRQAKQALQIVPGAWLSLSDPAGQFVMSTLIDVGEPFPPRGKLDVMAKAWATGRPQVSDIVMGPLSKRQNAYIEYPVFKAGAPLYTIVVGLNPDRFHALVLNKFGDGAAIGILDHQRKFVARIPDHDARVGTSASESWQAAIARSPEDWTENVTLEGERSLLAYVPTRDGWTAGLSYSKKVLDAPLRRILWSMGLLGSVLLFTSVAVAFGLGRLLTGIMMELKRTAQQVGHGEIVTAKPFMVEEAAAISKALSATSGELASSRMALRQSETKYRGIFNAAFQYTGLLSPDGCVLEVNKSALDSVGIAAEEAIGSQFWQVAWWTDHPEDQRRIKEAVARAAGGEFLRLEAGYSLKDGSEAFIDFSLTPLRDETGKIAFLIAEGRDITDLKNSETTVRAGEARFRGTFDNTAVGMAHVGLDGRFLEVNQRLCEILGYSKEELQSRTFQELTHPDDLEADLNNLRKLRATECSSYAMDKRYIRKDGSFVWTGLSVTVQRDETGTPQYFIKVVRDITERKEAQAHQQFLLRELAHRSKNQLAVIQSMTRQSARSATSMGDFEQRFGQRVQGLAVSIDLLVGQNWSGAALDDLVHRQLEVFAAASDARLRCEGPKVTVNADAAQAIGLALHELATNSVKYGAWSSPTGVVTVSWLLERNGAETPRLRLTWLERGGPVVTPPTRKGFGHMVIEQMTAQKLQAEVKLTFAREGLCWMLSIPSTHFDHDSRRSASASQSTTMN